jgi:hypothetical protein
MPESRRKDTPGGGGTGGNRPMEGVLNLRDAGAIVNQFLGKK